LPCKSNLSQKEPLDKEGVGARCQIPGARCQVPGARWWDEWEERDGTLDDFDLGLGTRRADLGALEPVVVLVQVVVVVVVAFVQGGLFLSVEDL
jgi:hypothetical protein